jgi:hypothetical protein
MNNAGIYHLVTAMGKVCTKEKAYLNIYVFSVLEKSTSDVKSTL